MLRPEELDLYIQATQEEAKWKKTKDQLRPVVLDYLRKGHYEDIYFSKPKSSPKFDPRLLYQFLQTVVPAEVLEPITLPIVDEKALDELFACGYFEIDDIPLECYSESIESTRINIVKAKA